MWKFLAFLSCALLIGRVGCAKRQLINFQVYEEDHVYRSELYVDSRVDLSSELRLSDEQANQTGQKLTEVYDAKIDIRLPIPMKVDGKLRKIKAANERQKISNVKDGSNSFDRTIYRLNLNVGDLYRVQGDVNQTQRSDGRQEFTSDLDFESLQSKLAGKYRGSLLLDEMQCPKLTLYHNFTTNLENLVRFSSNLTEECQLTNDRNETEDQMKITIDLAV